MFRAAAFTNLVDLLRARADAEPAKTAFVVESSEFGRSAPGYGELDVRARATAAHLHACGIEPGDRALLLYAPGIEYVVGFLGCLYANVIAVPVFPPSEQRQVERLHAIARDATAKVALTETAILTLVRQRFAAMPEVQELRWETTDALQPGLAADWRSIPIAPDSLAFLQYTSGSTAAPKGVMIDHGNLMHNSSVIARVLGVHGHTRAVSWLPPYHDMGLIGGIVQPLYSGFPCLLMPPLTFLRDPYRWLSAISAFRGTSSAAPDFAYAECARRISDEQLATLDLSCWERALVGAEPVRRTTLDAFAERFAPAGFQPAAFVPCYGLAEATLFVSGFKTAGTPATRVIDRAALAHDRIVAATDGASYVGCGRAHGDQFAVVDPLTRRVCAAGTVGEIWVTGPSVTSGYWGNDELTGQTFGVQLAGDREHRWLRSGDLGFLDGGELYVTGRLKDLIVVRGANYYPADIEMTAERSCDGVLPGRAAAFAVDDGDSEAVVLVCETAPRAELAATVGAIMAAVSVEHGLVLRELVMVRRGGLPRTSSGKIRRGECRTRYLADVLSVLSRAGQAGVTGAGKDGARPVADADPRLAELVAVLRALAARVLERDVDAVEPMRSLVSQGLDSLGASRLRAEALKALRVEVDLPTLLSSTSLAEIATNATELRMPPIERRADTTRIPATFGQERLWLLDKLGAGAAYHITGTLPLPSDFDLAALRESIRALIDRHEALRSGVRLAEDGQLDQLVLPAAELDVPVFTIGGQDGGEAEIREWAARPFDSAEPPLVRTAVFGAGTRWMLALCVHHIVVDGRSLLLLAGELGATYTALTARRPVPLVDPSVRYRDFAAWQRERSQEPDALEALDHWRSRLAGAVPPELTADPALPDADPFAGDSVPIVVPADLVRRLRLIGAADQATLFMVLAAAFSALLGRWSGDTDVLFGTALAGRSRPELADVVGFFVNTVPLRIDLSGDPTFRDAIGRARNVCLDAWAHQDVPFERIVREIGAERDAAGHRSLVQHLLVLHEARPSARFAREHAEAVLLPGGAKVDLELDLSPSPDGSLTGTLTYATALFDRATAERLVVGLGQLLNAAAATPEHPVSALPVMAPADHDGLLACSAGDPRSLGVDPTGPDLTVPRLFETVADRMSSSPAIVDHDGTIIDYAELDRWSNRLARYLRQRGVGAEDRIAVWLHRGIELGVAVLAVLKAGAVYLPLDPESPAERTRQLLADGRPALIVTTSELAEQLAVAPDSKTSVVLDVAAERIAATADDRAVVAIPPLSAAYVLYTSGSTGRPKGAVNTHAALANRLRWAASTHSLSPGDRVLQKTSIGFDVSIWELLLPLVTGATLVFARPGGHRDPDYLHRLMVGRNVTTCHFVPSMLRAYLADPRRELPVRQVICSGEVLPRELAVDLVTRFPDVELLNLYGPTEAAIDVTIQRVDMPVPHRIPIGAPVPGSALYVLDAHLRPQPIGVPGQLFIGGVQIARGYLDRPGLTAQYFVPHPFLPGERLYATGDRVRWRADRRLDYLGRLDQQLKIRGNRVEPSEIEATLTVHPGVNAAIVTGQCDAAGEPYLVGYLVVTDEGPSDKRIREFLASRLPGYMVPAAFCRLGEFPLLPNGKIDRAGLPPVSRQNKTTVGYVAPRTPVERSLARIWAEVLGIEAVGIRHDFFELGGHSLMAVRIVGRVGAELGVDITVARILSESATVEHLARIVEELQLDQADPAELRNVFAMLDGLSDAEAASLVGEE